MYSLSFVVLVRRLSSISTTFMTSDCLVHCDLGDDLPFWWIRNIYNFREHLDARQIEGMRLSGDAQTIRDAWHGREEDTAMGVGRKHWWQLGSHGGSNLNC